MSKNYTIYHLHSQHSNGTTEIDSVTKYTEYVERAKECGMTALGFAEHGNIFEWYNKKTAIEQAGMKYIHAIEAYVTADDYDFDSKTRDNYHFVLIAKNKDGWRELNRLSSQSFAINPEGCTLKDKSEDVHFYYNPRFTIEEIFKLSQNIIITTACLGGVLNKGSEELKQRIIEFLAKNKDRCFLEIQHHNCPEQITYNQYLYGVSKKYDIPLIAGTDTHSLNESHERGRYILKLAKAKARKREPYDDSMLDLKFKTYDELIDSYRIQNSLPEEVYIEAIENTNRMANMVEPFELDKGMKYPQIYDDPEKTFEDKVRESIKNHKYINERYSKDEIEDFLAKEMPVYKKTNSISFMLLQTYLREWEKSQGIQCGYGRGSVSGSMVAYALGITQMDSIRFNLNFFRFMNPARVSLADIDTDYGEEDREKVKTFLLKDHMGLKKIRTAEIITFNTIAVKGAIRDVCRALDIPLEIADKISKEYNNSIDELRKKYPEYSEMFDYVEIVNGTIVSIGTHPSGVLVSDLNLSEEVGLCSTSNSPYPVSVLNMKELDANFYVKLDLLGLDNISLINKTCKEVGIERLNPDNTNLNDEDVWKSIRDDTTTIFQWESNSAQQYLKKFMSDKTIAIAKQKIPNFSMIKWLSFGNGLIRPSCASFRDEVANGNFYDNGFDELNEFLAPEAGRVAMQETIMQFLVRFCGYSDAESDTVRRCVDEETLITMSNGKLRKIKDIKPGYHVLTYNEKTKKFKKSFVRHVFDNGIKYIYLIGTEDGRKIKATFNHKFLTNRGWRTTKQLCSEDKILMKDKTWSTVVQKEEYGEAHVYDLQIDTTHTYIANDMVVHNCIAKKKGTETLLPEIRQRFVDYSSQNFPITKEKCELIIEPFIKAIEDASDYAFSWNHSDSYSITGYICGYLRYYYPYEFLTVALNVFSDKVEKTEAIIKFAKKIGIKIMPPKYGISKADYFYNKEKGAIAKGISSVKYMNSQIADELYEISKREHASFIDLLKDIWLNSSANSRQVTGLIKIDFFSDFGNQRELIAIYDLFLKFKYGEAKSMARDSIEGTELYDIVSRYSTDKNKDGSPSKNYKLLDTMVILRELEEKVKSLNMPDLGIILKAENFKEYMGYEGYVSGIEDDRNKLCVLNVYPLKRKRDNKQFGYSIITRSVGSGIESRFTVFNRVYDAVKVHKGDYIKCLGWSRDGQYFTLNKYEQIFS